MSTKKPGRIEPPASHLMCGQLDLPVFQQDMQLVESWGIATSSGEGLAPATRGQRAPPETIGLAKEL